MPEDLANTTNSILASYDPATPQLTAKRLKQLWLQFQPKSVASIKAEQRAVQETVGIPIPVLKSIGREVGKVAAKRVDTFMPLTSALWDEYGREGRVVSSIVLGKMELADPETIIPQLMAYCRTCVTWEDADRLAMDALEPIVRKSPAEWLPRIEPWLVDQNKWVRRAGITVIGRLPMKHAEYTERCLELAQHILNDQEVEVKKAVSFAIRVSARGDLKAVHDFLVRHVPPQEPAATWVLCDVIRSMTKSMLPELVDLLPLYEQWAADDSLSAKDRRSVESAVRVLIV